MINLFHINNYTVNTNGYKNLLHDPIVNEFEQKIAAYVGAKYAVGVNSATSAIFLSLLNKKVTVNIPSVIPPVVLNAIITSGNRYSFNDNVSWVGDSYVLHNFGNYKIIDSAQKLQKNQFKYECNDSDLLIYSFYPTKPVGSCDGGIIVSNDKNKINFIRELSFNGMSYAENNWDRKIKMPGYKMYMNSIQAEIALKNFLKYENKLKYLQTIKEKYNKAFRIENTSNHLYRIQVKNRNKIQAQLFDKKITTGIHYNALHLNPVYSLNKKWNLPNSELIDKTTLSVPFHEKLSKKEIDYIIKNINGSITA